jgi:NAD(P)-dependent dehydrogenase (short-subunit alcohol dehydrogenase family)
MSITDKVVIISGATGGLGETVSQVFYEAGAKVTLIGREQKTKPLVEAWGQERTLALEANLVKPEEAERVVAATLDRFGRVDILLNLAGGFSGGQPVSETPLDVLDAMLDINLRTAYNMCHAALKPMIDQQWGRIVNIGSRDALVGRAGYSAYGISKAGVVRLTETIAAEVKYYNITANVILPGTIDTEANRQAMPTADFSKWVKPAEIAQVMLFLAGENNLINGAAIPVFGQT